MATIKTEAEKLVGQKLKEAGYEIGDPLPKRSIHWALVFSIRKRLSNLLTDEEESNLTPEATEKINSALLDMHKLSEVVYTEMEVARNLNKSA